MLIEVYLSQRSSGDMGGNEYEMIYWSNNAVQGAPVGDSGAPIPVENHCNECRWGMRSAHPGGGELTGGKNCRMIDRSNNQDQVVPVGIEKRQL